MHQNQITTKTYGTKGPHVILLHGGPGAPGYLKPIAQQLQQDYQTLEPYQRPSSPNSTLTVDQHITDLHNVIQHYCPNTPPALLGHSWGAMLALAYAAKYPKSTSSLALIGCGTFDLDSRKKLNETRQQRLGKSFEQAYKELSEKYPNPHQALNQLGNLIKQVDAYQLIESADQEPPIECDADAHHQTWQDMIKLQEQNIYPQTFTNIKCPAVIIQGSYDPHPAEMIHANLKQYIPHLQLITLEKCGHYPWQEQHAHKQFYETLTNWLQTNTK